KEKQITNENIDQRVQQIQQSSELTINETDGPLNESSDVAQVSTTLIINNDDIGNGTKEFGPKYGPGVVGFDIETTVIRLARPNFPNDKKTIFNFNTNPNIETNDATELDDTEKQEQIGASLLQ